MNNIIVIGLPASGKSYLSLKYKHTHLIYDDFLDSFINGNLLNDLNNTSHIFASDPRLCNKNIFDNYIRPYFSQSNTILILFENDPDACILNLNNRPNKDKWINTIYNFSKIYSLDNYDGYYTQIHKVYKHI